MLFFSDLTLCWKCHYFQCTYLCIQIALASSETINQNIDLADLRFILQVISLVGEAGKCFAHLKWIYWDMFNGMFIGKVHIVYSYANGL